MSVQNVTRDQWFEALDALERNEDLYSDLSGAIYYAMYGEETDDATLDQYQGKIAREYAHSGLETFTSAHKLSDAVREICNWYDMKGAQIALLEVLDRAVHEARPDMQFDVKSLLTAES